MLLPAADKSGRKIGVLAKAAMPACNPEIIRAGTHQRPFKDSGRPATAGKSAKIIGSFGAIRIRKFTNLVRKQNHKSSQKENFSNNNLIFGMKVHLIRKETIEDFARQNAQSRTSLEEWLSKVKNADWEKPEDIQATFRSTDLLGKGSSRVVFDIAGNSYRMICKYAFGDKQVHLFVLWIGTHAAYDELCDKKEQYTVSIY